MKNADNDEKEVTMTEIQKRSKKRTKPLSEFCEEYKSDLVSIDERLENLDLEEKENQNPLNISQIGLKRKTMDTFSEKR